MLLLILQYGGFLIAAMFTLILMSIYLYAYKDNVIIGLPDGIEREVNNYSAFKNDPFLANNATLIDYIQNTVSLSELILQLWWLRGTKKTKFLQACMINMIFREISKFVYLNHENCIKTNPEKQKTLNCKIENNYY